MGRKPEPLKTESELLKNLNEHTAHADELAQIRASEWGDLPSEDRPHSPGQRDQHPLDRLRGSVLKYEGATTPVWPDEEESDGKEHDARILAAGEKTAPVVLRILNSWGMDDEAQACVLGLSIEELGQAKRLNSFPHFSENLLRRVSYILNIYEFSKIAFTDPIRFLSSANFNAPYNGQTSLAFISSGDVENLERLFKDLEFLSRGGW
ncbi:MAG: hypothetical protein KA296_11675 [Marinobacter sp.]|nr:hypothetical protein [Marinobacter sp.]